MKTTQGAAHNHIMSTTQVPRPRIEPKTLGVTCSYFTTLPLRRIKVKSRNEFASLCGNTLLYTCGAVQTGLLAICPEINVIVHI